MIVGFFLGVLCSAVFAAGVFVLLVIFVAIFGEIE